MLRIYFQVFFYFQDVFCIVKHYGGRTHLEQHGNCILSKYDEYICLCIVMMNKTVLVGVENRHSLSGTGQAGETACILPMNESRMLFHDERKELTDNLD